MRVFARAVCPAALFVLLATAATGSEVVVPFPAATAQFAISDGLTRLHVPTFSDESSPGDPALPHFDTFVLLPPDADVSSLHVEIRNPVTEDVPGVFSVAPSPPAVLEIDGKRIEQWGAGKEIEDGRNVLVYEADQLYPPGFATTDFESKLGSYLLVPVSFWPYRYNPVAGRIVHLTSADVALVFNSKITAQAASADSAPSDRLKQLAMNWTEAGSWYSTGRSFVQSGPATPLAIITTSAIASASTQLANLVAEKTNLGFTVTVATEADWGGGTGDLAAERIRAWLKVNYTTKARYTILIGNPNPASGDVPMKKLWPRHGAGDGYEDAPSDYYYADLTGNWDLDGDGYYGEYPGDFGSGGVDRVPEVIVGRIPYYGSISDLDKILRKIITYETTPGVGAWVQRMLLPMKPLDASTPSYHLGEAIKNDAATPAGLSAFRVYDNVYGLNPPPELYPCSEAGVVAEWQKGYGFVFFDTHGNTDIAASILTTGNCPNLDDDYPSFVFSAACLNANPEYSSNLAYNLLKNGAIATVAATRVSWYYPGQTSFAGSDSNAGMAYTYALRLVRDGQRCGDAFFNMNSGLSSAIWMNHVVFNLYGDPTVASKLAASLKITNTSLAAGAVGQSYSAVLAPEGGTAPYQWSISAGALPSGLALDTAAGTVTGVPDRSGSFWFTVRLTDNAGAAATEDFTINIKMVAYSFPLDTDPGWQPQSAWAFGVPTGGGSGNHDPTSGHTGGNVFGYNLAGDYSNSISATQYLTTSAIDCSGLVGTTLSFWRWLGVETSIWDHANVQVSANGSNWTTVWSNPADSTLSESTWTKQTYDISAIADLQAMVYVRWGMGTTNSHNSYPGWNIDDIEISGCAYEPVSAISSVKAEPEQTACLLSGKIVTGVYPGWFYMQEPSGYQGIRVVWNGPILEGLLATVFGTMGTMNGEKTILADSVTQTGAAPLIRPVGMPTRALGGGAFAGQQAVWSWGWIRIFGHPPQHVRLSAKGLNNVGTLVRVAGKVTQIDPAGNYFYLDDGSLLEDGTVTGSTPNVGVRIQWSGLGLSPGQFIMVTGNSSGFTDSGYFWRVLLPRRASDISP